MASSPQIQTVAERNLVAATKDRDSKEHDVEKNEHEPTQDEASADSDLSSVPITYKYFTPRQLMLSKYMIMQLIFNVVASFIVAVIAFTVVVKGNFAWTSGAVLAPILVSPWCCAVGSLLYAPFGMSDALQRGWFGAVKQSHVTGKGWALLPFLHVRIGILRHLIMGTMLGCVVIPPAILFVRFYFGKMLTSQEQSWFSVLYITLLPFVIMPAGLLAFAVEPNLIRAMRIVGPQTSIITKGLKSPLC